MVALASLQLFGMWRSRTHQIKAANELLNLKKDTEKIIKHVNGPLGVALESVAIALEREARKTMGTTDILNTHTARQAFELHREQQQRDAESAKRTQEEERRIIEEFLKSQNQKTP